MKILIVYESITGNTKEIAMEIYNALKQDYQVQVKNVVDVLEDYNEYDADLYFLGSWTNRGTSGNLINEFVKTLKNKKIALFGTTGFDQSSEYFSKLTERFYSKFDSSNSLVDSFHCKGRMRESVRASYVKLLKDHPDDKSLEVKIENFDDAKSHPNQSDLTKAKEFALKVVSEVK